MEYKLSEKHRIEVNALIERAQIDLEGVLSELVGQREQLRDALAATTSSADRARNALNRMQSIALLPDGAHPRSVLRGYIAHAEELLDWAETLLCNAFPQEHCSRAEWDSIVARWRDKKSTLSSPNAGGVARPAAE